MQIIGPATVEDFLGQAQSQAFKFEVADDPIEIITDGGLENWASATDLSSWGEYKAGTSTVNRESTTIHGGTYSARMDIDGSGSLSEIYQYFYLWPEGNYTWSFWYKAPVGKSIIAYIVESSWALGLNSSGQWVSSYGIILDGTGDWAQYTLTFRGLENFTLFQMLFANNGGTTWSYYIDDVSLIGIPWVDLARTLEPEATIDGSLEEWTSSSNLLYWTEILGGTGTVARAGSLGSYCAEITCDGSGTLTYIYQVVRLARLHRYNLGFWYKTNAGKNGRLYLMNTTTSRYLNSSLAWTTTVSYIPLPDTSAAWAYFPLSFITDVAGLEAHNFSIGAAEASAVLDIDEITLRPDPSYVTSMSCSVAGAGPKTEPLAGEWSASIRNTDGIFMPYHPTSGWADLIELGREVRLSWGMKCPGYLVFNGTSDYVEVPDNAVLDITSAITIEAWVYQHSRTSWATVVTKGVSTGWASNNYTVGLQSGRVDFRWGGAGSALVAAGGELWVDTWNHVVCVAEAGTTNALKVYINGVLKAQGNRSGDPTAGATALRIGTDAITSSGDFLNGRISDVRIYSRALGATEVGEHYQQRFISESGLVAHWAFSELSGEDADDLGPNGLDGKIRGATHARTNSLVNGTFELWASSTDANGWTEEKYGSSTVTQESGIVHGGTYSVKCEIVGGSNADLFQQITLESNTRYRFGGWYRTDGTAKGWVVVYAGPSFTEELRGDISAPAWVVGNGQGMTPLDPTTSWTRFDCLFKTPSAYTSYLFAVGTHLSTNGSTYWDDLEVVPVDDEAEFLYWNRVVGYMDNPKFNLGEQMISVSGTDRMKALADLNLYSPWTRWGGTETFDSKASPGGVGTEIYDEADCCEIGAGEADNVTPWSAGGSGGAVTSEGPGDESPYFLLFERDGPGPTAQYAHNSNVGSGTAGTKYIINFWAMKTGDHLVRLIVYQTSGSTAVPIAYVYISDGGWLDYQEVVTVTATGNIQLRLESSGKYADDGDQAGLDEISIKAYDPDTWNIYELPPEANGVHFVELDGEPVWQGDEDGKGGWHVEGEPGSLALFFSEELVINDGTDNLVVYYYSDTAPEDMVADLLVAGHLYATRAAAKTAMTYVATGVLIGKPWFEDGTTGVDAIRMICERVNYRFWFGYGGTPIFRPAPTVADPPHFNLGSTKAATSAALSQDLGEVRNHVTIQGCERSVLNVSTSQVERSNWKGEAQDPGSILAYKENTHAIQNHLFQDQESIDNMATELLAYFKDPKIYVDFSLDYMPAPLEVGDTVAVYLPVTQALSVLKYAIIRAISLSAGSAKYTCEIFVPFTTQLVVQNASMDLSGQYVELDYPGTLAVSDAAMGLSAEAPVPSQTFTYTTEQAGTSRAVPAGATQAIIECWGSGGDGGDGEMVGRAGGGGGGGYSKATVSVNDTQTLVLYLMNNDDTYVTRSSTTLCLAKCGADGDLTGGGAGGAAGSGTGDTKYSGGNGYFYTTGNTGGGGGSSAGTGSNGNNATSSTGASAVTGGGNGGNGGARYNDGSDPTTPPGGGGGGAGSDLSTETYGGEGSLGKIRITFS